MSAEAARQQKRYTWQDYRSWPDDERWQIIDGEAIAMTAAPLVRHQKLVSRLSRRFEEFLEGRACDSYPSPIDVRLSDDDIVQPDIAIVCDPGQIEETHIEGPPALIVEVLSPSTELLDRGRKLDLYAHSGVKEVWLVKPDPSLIEIFLLADGSYRRAGAFTREDDFRSPTLPEMQLDLRALFDLPIPPAERIELVKEGRPPPYAADAARARQAAPPVTRGET